MRCDKCNGTGRMPHSAVTNLEQVKNAAQNIMGGISWAETPQGSLYWRQVHDNLEELMRED